MFGKPNDNTYQFAEDLLEKHRQDVLGKAALPPLRRVYMVGGMSVITPFLFHNVMYPLLAKPASSLSEYAAPVDDFFN